MKKTSKIRFLIKKYFYFFSVNFCFGFIALYYSLKSNWGEDDYFLEVIYVFFLILLIVFTISSITILPLDLYYLRKDKALCRKFGVKYHDFLFWNEDEKELFRKRPGTRLTQKNTEVQGQEN